MVHESESIVASGATSVAATSCREIASPDDRGKILPAAGWFARMVRSLWHRKVAAHLHFLLGASERTCRAWASGTEPSASIFVALLRSDQGGRVLAFVMAGATAPWWRELRRARIVADAYDAGRQRIEQFELALD